MAKLRTSKQINDDDVLFFVFTFDGGPCTLKDIWASCMPRDTKRAIAVAKVNSLVKKKFLYSKDDEIYLTEAGMKHLRVKKE